MATHHYRKFDWFEDYQACTLSKVLNEAYIQQAKENARQNQAARAESERTGRPLVLGWINTLDGFHVLHRRLTWKGWVRRLLRIRKPGTTKQERKNH